MVYVCKVGRSGGCGRWEWQVGVTGGRGSAYEDSHIQSPFIHVIDTTYILFIYCHSTYIWNVINMYLESMTL